MIPTFAVAEALGLYRAGDVWAGHWRLFWLLLASDEAIEKGEAT